MEKQEENGVITLSLLTYCSGKKTVDRPILQANADINGIAIDDFIFTSVLESAASEWVDVRLICRININPGST